MYRSIVFLFFFLMIRRPPRSTRLTHSFPTRRSSDLCSAIGLKRPDLHFAEALAAELCLAAQRLLGDEAVRSDRPGVDLVVHQMVQLQHLDVADSHLAVELLARAAAVQLDLTRAVEPGQFQNLRHARLARTAEHRRRPRPAALHIADTSRRE